MTSRSHGAPTREALFVLGVLTVAFVAAIIGITLWLTSDGGGGGEAEPPPAPPPPPPAAVETSAATTEAPPAETAATTEAGGETAAPAGDAAAGKEIFASAGCVSCHTLADAGATGTVGPNLDESMPSYDLVVERVTNGSGVMPPFAGQLSETDIANVAAYVSSVAGG